MRISLVRLTLLILLVSASPAVAKRRQPARPHATNIYVSQYGAGAHDGRSCATARSVGWLDAPDHWGPGAAIHPDVIVNLCGTVSSPVVAHGSGRPGHPVTIHFESGASISLPVCPGRGAGCLNTNGNRYLTIDGGRNGIIESTSNGTRRPDHLKNALGIWALDCSGCVIEHLSIRDMYVHTSALDTAADADNGIMFSGSNVTIRYNTLHDDDWALAAEWQNGDANIRIYGNDIYNIDHGFASTAGFAGGSIGPVYFYRNHVHDYANWDTVSAAYHHDGLHCYTYGGQGPAHYAGMYIYDNRFDGATGADMTSHVFIEGGTGPSATPCADATSPIFIFNNVLSASTVINNGLMDPASGEPHVYNNTFIGHSTQGGSCYTSNSDASHEVFQNNVLTTCDGLMYNNALGIYLPGSPDYNVYADGGENAFICGTAYDAFGQFRRWQACVHSDNHSRTAGTARLTQVGELERGSPARGAGKNLTYLCRGALVPLCFAIDGRRRPRSGPWDAGAY